MKNSLRNLKKVFSCLTVLISLNSNAFSVSEVYNDPNNLSASELDLVCPSSETWINCMPTINEPRSLECRPDVRNWLTEHCPNVHFAD